MGNHHESVTELLAEIKEQAEAEKAIYPDYKIQIQIDPLTFGFIKLELAVRHGAVFEENTDQEDLKLFGFDVLLNRRIKGRYAIAILIEQETGWKDRK